MLMEYCKRYAKRFRRVQQKCQTRVYVAFPDFVGEGAKCKPEAA
jgi:hypothetical protein